MTRHSTPPPLPGQGSLFESPDTPAPIGNQPAPANRSPRGSGGSPQRAAELLAEIEDGRYGVLDTTDRIVMFEDWAGTNFRVRHALDENAIVALISSGCVEEAPNRDAILCLHGVIRRPVTPLRLTNRGRLIYHRWNALVPMTTKDG